MRMLHGRKHLCRRILNSPGERIIRAGLANNTNLLCFHTPLESNPTEGEADAGLHNLVFRLPPLYAGQLNKR